MKRRAVKKSYRGVAIVGVVVVLVVAGILVFSRMHDESNERAIASLAKRYAREFESARAAGQFRGQEEAVYGELGTLVTEPGISVMGAVMAVVILNDAVQNARSMLEQIKDSPEDYVDEPVK